MATIVKPMLFPRFFCRVLCEIRKLNAASAVKKSMQKRWNKKGKEKEIGGRHHHPRADMVYYRCIGMSFHT
jgi:hypothetical protein